MKIEADTIPVISVLFNSIISLSYLCLHSRCLSKFPGPIYPIQFNELQQVLATESSGTMTTTEQM